jgi:hypothetical protein
LKHTTQSLDGWSMIVRSDKYEYAAAMIRDRLAYPKRCTVERETMASQSKPTVSARCPNKHGRGPKSRRRTAGGRRTARALLVSLLSTSPALVAGQCFSLEGSTACPAWQGASVSLNRTIAGTLYVGRLWHSFPTGHGSCSIYFKNFH